MRTIGILNIIFGGLGILSGFVGIIALLIQRLVFKLMEQPVMLEDETAGDFFSAMISMNDLGLIATPFTITISVLFLIGGIRILKKQPNSVNTSILACYMGIIFYAIYIIVYRIYFIQSLFDMVPYLNKSFLDLMFIVGTIIGGVFVCGYPVFLLIYLKKSRYEKYFEQSV